MEERSAAEAARAAKAFALGLALGALLLVMSRLPPARRVGATPAGAPGRRDSRRRAG